MSARDELLPGGRLPEIPPFDPDHPHYAGVRVVTVKDGRYVDAPDIPVEPMFTPDGRYGVLGDVTTWWFRLVPLGEVPEFDPRYSYRDRLCQPVTGVDTLEDLVGRAEVLAWVAKVRRDELQALRSRGYELYSFDGSEFVLWDPAYFRK